MLEIFGRKKPDQPKIVDGRTVSPVAGQEFKGKMTLQQNQSWLKAGYSLRMDDHGRKIIVKIK